MKSKKQQEPATRDPSAKSLRLAEKILAVLRDSENSSQEGADALALALSVVAEKIEIFDKAIHLAIRAWKEAAEAKPLE